MAGEKQLISYGPPPSLTKCSVVATEPHSVFLHYTNCLETEATVLLDGSWNHI